MYSSLCDNPESSLPIFILLFDSPPLFPPLRSLLFPLFCLLLFPIHQLLNPKSQAYWRTTREAKFGKKLEEFDTEDDWKALEIGLSTVKEILEQNGEGKDLLFTGSQVTQIDIQLAAILVFGKVVFGEESKQWKRIASWHDGKWARFLQQFAKYESVEA